MPASLLTLSLDLKRQHVHASVRAGAWHVAALAIEEAAALRLADPAACAESCDRFVASLHELIGSQYAVAAVWGKANVGLHLKLTCNKLRRPQIDDLLGLIQAKKQSVAETLTLLRHHNHMLSKMLRDHPRATERGFSASDQWSLALHKRLQRLSIDAALLSREDNSRRLSPERRRRTVSFDTTGPSIIGEADATVDRRPMDVSRPVKMELLILRGSRVLHVVV
ncbi:Aste57867_25231 [Aphanomyces stellatus]|uniref:Aste57867_25231 protein n=1 Tax=Aphanomyces stellatus TaxID=120398 RepID=A0A485LX74_9STRA|nr:hypothetical protein As57867_025153 [Aphanomyces stellatus]VFU01858.1 Aste57867_25231 [Aphanomyces stellatus]